MTAKGLCSQVMTLLLVALAYLLGLAAARWWWEAAALAAPLPAWLWLLPVLLLPFAPLLNRLPPPKPQPPLRWPAAAGFEPPDEGVKFGLPAALALCFLAGALRYGGQPFTRTWTPADLAYYNLPAAQAFDREAPAVTVTGFVDSYPLVVDGVQEFYLAATAIQAAGMAAPSPVGGSVRVTSAAPRLRYGQPVAVRGRLSAPGVFDGFSYADYLAVKGIRSVIYRAEVQARGGAAGGSPLRAALYALRARGAALLDRSLPEPYAALANGMLLGIEAGIPDALYAEFNIAGASHVIVISGTNVALIAGVVIAVAVRLLGRRRGLWPALAAIACYALLVGGDASVLRAGVMGGLFVTAAALDRRSTALVSLAAACLLMTLANPLALWDVGLQMSSMGTAGLVLLTPLFVRGLRRTVGRSGAFLRAAAEDVLAVTLGASLATLPLVLYYFGRLSLVSLPANLLIAPAQPLILFGGSAALLVGLAGLEGAASALLWLPWLGLAWTVAAVRWCAGLPWAAVNVSDFGPLHLALAYAALGAVRWQRPLRNKLALHWAALASGAPVSAPAGPVAQTSASAAASAPAPASWARRRAAARLLVAPLTLLAAAALAALLWAAVLAQPDGRLHVWFLDVGQGDGILIQTPSGRQVLIDGGASGQALLGELGAVMPFWDRSLDLVVLTHPDADHMAAQAEAVGRFAVGAAWTTPAGAASPDSAAWRTAVAGAGAQVQLQHGGGWADLGDGVALWVLGPPASGFTGADADNENSLVAKLVYGDFSVLLTGDAGAAAEAQLVGAGAPLPATVLKVAHHGSKFSTSASFVRAVNPALAVIQVGADNDYGHPSAETLDRLAGRTILRTDKNGRVELTSDGRQVWVETGS